MRRTGWIRWVVLITLPLVVQSHGLPQTSKAVEVRSLRYSELAEMVTKHRGKVVVVDFWATYCPPCVKELPNIVQMHKKHAAQGLVTITVSLDQVQNDPNVKLKVWQHLQKAEAHMPNVILNEEFALVQKKLRIDGPPCLFVFNRQGKWVEFKEEKFRHDLIEQTVVQFLKEK